MNNNKYIDRITVQSPKEDKNFEDYNVFSPKDLDESLTFSNEWSSKKGIHFVIRNGKLVGITKNGNPVMAQNGVIYTESTEPFSFTIGGNTYNVESGPQWTELNVEGITSLASMFKGINCLTSLSLCMDTSQLREIGDTFAGCTNLISLDLSQWNTTNVTNMSSMFSGCSHLITLDVSGWDTSAVINMYNMFYGCSSLTSLDVSGWDTSAVINMYNMFYGCSSLTSLDVSGWDTSAVTNFFSMFRDCSKLQALDCSNWDVSAANNIESFFRSCKALKELKTNGFTNSICTSVYCMFIGCETLQVIDISGLDPSNVTDAYGTFIGCYALTALRWPMMGKIKADRERNSTIHLSTSPLDRASLDSIFTYDRTTNGLTNPLTVQLSSVSKALLTAEEIAAITAKGYTIA